MFLFSIATLAPLALIGAAAFWGGIWAILAPLWMTGFTASLDEVIRRVSPPAEAEEFPAANALSALLAIGHLTLLPLCIWALSGQHIGGWEKAGLFAAMGLFAGQISNSNAHELIHRGNRFLRGLGMWVYISNLYGHHTSAHVLIHHRHVGTTQDPNTARMGESFYHFSGRAWRGSFRAGLAAETARRGQIGRPAWRHPYLGYLAGTAACLILACGLGGTAGVVYFIALGAFATLQLLMSDYVQHYGLWRAIGPNGKPVPVDDHHSWNSPHWFSSALMLNAPRHSDHHAHPARPYPALRLTDAAPMLPRSVPVMACVALYPRMWRRVMDPRARAVQKMHL